MNGKKQLYWIGGTFAVLMGLFLLSRIPPENAPATTLAGVELKTLDGSKSVELGACPTPKCLTVYVAPWCGICRRSTPFINALRDYLSRHNVETRIIVGRDRPAEVAGYAPDFGPDTLVDAEGRYPLQGGVPNFTVTTPSGEVLKVTPGVPGLYEAPFPDDLMRKMGEYLGLN